MCRRRFRWPSVIEIKCFRPPSLSRAGPSPGQARVIGDPQSSRPPVSGRLDFFSDFLVIYFFLSVRPGQGECTKPAAVANGDFRSARAFWPTHRANIPRTLTTRHARSSLRSILPHSPRSHPTSSLLAGPLWRGFYRTLRRGFTKLTGRSHKTD